MIMNEAHLFLTDVSHTQDDVPSSLPSKEQGDKYLLQNFYLFSYSHKQTILC